MKKHKKVFIFIFFLVMIVVLTFVVIKNNNINKSKRIINTTLTALKETNIEEVDKYMNYSELIDILDENLLDVEKMQNDGLNKVFFENLDWDIEAIEINGSDIITTIKMTNKDFKIIITNWIKTLVSEKECGNNLNEDACLEKLRECASDSNVSIQTVTKKITLKKDNAWKIIVNDELGNALFPGIESVNSIIEEM